MYGWVTVIAGPAREVEPPHFPRRRPARKLRIDPEAIVRSALNQAHLWCALPARPVPHRRDQAPQGKTGPVHLEVASVFLIRHRPGEDVLVLLTLVDLATVAELPEGRHALEADLIYCRCGDLEKLNVKLCVPVTDVFHSRRDVLLSIVDAVSFKKPSDEIYAGKAHFLECSYNIADVDFPAKLQQSGLLNALRSGKYESFAYDIGPNCETVRGYSPNGFPRALPTSQPISDEEYFERAAKNVEWLRDQYSGYIQVENLNYFPTGAYERVCEPEFICHITEAAGVGLLLDIGHAVVSAHYLGYDDAISYINGLPLHRVREVQISHAGILEGVFEDLHEAPGEAELSIVRKIIANGYDIEYLTVEYYRDPDILCDVYRSIKERLQ